jgi:hypothetical protein
MELFVGVAWDKTLGSKRTSAAISVGELDTTILLRSVKIQCCEECQIQVHIRFGAK